MRPMHTVLDSLNEIRSMMGGDNNSKAFGLILAGFTIVFVFLWFLWPVLVIGFFLSTWASVGVLSVAAWAAFKFWIAISICNAVAFAGMIITGLTYQTQRDKS